MTLMSNKSFKVWYNYSMNEKQLNVIVKMKAGSHLYGTSSPESDKEAIEIGIESEKRSINVLLKLLESEKKMDVRVVFSHLLAEEKKHLIALESLKNELLAEEP